MNIRKLLFLSLLFLTSGIQLNAMNPSNISDLEKAQEKFVNSSKTAPQQLVAIQKAIAAELMKDPRSQKTQFGVIADKKTINDAIQKVLATPLDMHYALLIFSNQVAKQQNKS